VALIADATYIQAINVICNTVQLIALAYIASKMPTSGRVVQGEDR
jgi:hypothetical protein